MTRIRVELGDVFCGNTEDVTGADEFYLVGAVGPLAGSGVSNPVNKGIRTKPISINDRQTRILGGDIAGGVVYDADLPETAILQVSLLAYDEDLASDWSKYGETVTKIGAGVTTAVNMIPGAGSIGTIIPTILSVAGSMMRFDKDDLLGKHQRTFQVGTLVPGDSIQYFPFSRKDWTGWSNWSYTVRYRVFKGEGALPKIWGPTPTPSPGGGGGGGGTQGGSGRTPVYER